jgi:hypothetical protein
LFTLLKTAVDSFELKVESIRGQCDDGAAAMHVCVRGQYSGVAKGSKLK